jgi:PEP-CTERM motif
VRGVSERREVAASMVAVDGQSRTSDARRGVLSPRRHFGYCAHASLDFTGQVVAPPFGQSPTAILTVPVDFSGAFNVDGVGGNQLIAAARATLTLQQTDCCGGPAWLSDGIRYELEPIPEPTTLLLFGSTMAGVGLAAWRKLRDT